MNVSEFLVNLADNLISLFTLSGERRSENDGATSPGAQGEAEARDKDPTPPSAP